MMNVLAMCLVLTSIVSGGIFSPIPQYQKEDQNQRGEDLIVKEANRVIMVEYEREARPRDSNNNPPPESQPSALDEKLSIERSMASSAIDGAKDKFKEASSVLPNMGQGLSSDSLPNEHYFNAKEVICDAYGKCKHKLSGVFGKARDEVEEALSKAKETVGGKAREVEEARETAVGKTKEGLDMAKERGKEELGKVKESISEKAQEVKHKGREAGENTMENVKNIGQNLKKGHNTVWDQRSVHTKEGGMNISIIFHRGIDAFKDAARHSVSKEVVNPTMGVAHLLGLATACGISVWVTFVSSHVLAGALPRQQFGIVQSKIYPAYFRALVGSIGCALLAHALRNPIFGLRTYQAYTMMASLGLVLFNLLYLEPRATKAMFDKMKMEKEEGRGSTWEEVGVELAEPHGCREDAADGATTTTATATTTTTEPGVTGAESARTEEMPEKVRSRLGVLNAKLKKLNSLSALLNVFTLMALTWQLVYLGKGLPVT